LKTQSPSLKVYFTGDDLRKKAQFEAHFVVVIASI